MDLNVVCDRFGLELGFGLHKIFNLGSSEIFYSAFNPYKRLDLGIKSIGHQFKFSIGGNKGDVSFGLKTI